MRAASCFTTRRLACSNSLCIEGVGMLASFRGKRKLRANPSRTLTVSPRLPSLSTSCQSKIFIVSSPNQQPDAVSRRSSLQIPHPHVREHGHVARALHGDLGAALMERAIARALPRIQLALSGAELEEHRQFLVVDDFRLVATEAEPGVLADLGGLLAAVVAIVSAAAAVPFDPGHLDLLFLG